MPLQKKKIEIPLTVDEALVQIERFCAYQDRYTKEIRAKLREYQLEPADAEQILHYLIEEKYVDDARFAEAYVRGKIRSNHWGRIKINLELCSKGIDQRLIDDAMEHFPKAEYLSILTQMVERKQQDWSELPPIVQRQKLSMVFLRSGYEQDLVISTINQLFARLGYTQ
jgi:regulatory protein